MFKILLHFLKFQFFQGFQFLGNPVLYLFNYHKKYIKLLFCFNQNKTFFLVKSTFTF